MRVDYLGLEAFVSIGERGSFKRAAAQLNLSPTALSHRIRKLEEDLGVKLLLRTTRSVQLSEAGMELLPRARRAIEEMRCSYEDLRNLGNTRQSEVALGCLPTLAVCYLGQVLQDFRIAWPVTKVRVFDVSKDEILELIRKGDAEFGLTIVSAMPQDIAIHPLVTEPYVVACSKAHPLAQQNSVGWADLEHHPMVRISASAGNRAIIDDALGSRRELLDWRYEVQHLATAISLVEANLAVAIIPELSIRASARLDQIAVLPLRHPAISRQLGIAQRRDGTLSPAASDLRDRIGQHIRAQRPGPEVDLAAE